MAGAGDLGGRRSAVVLLSGGLDSMVTAGLAHEAGFALHALTIDYGQRHRRELAAAEAIAAHLDVARHVVLPLDLRQFGGDHRIEPARQQHDRAALPRKITASGHAPRLGVRRVAGNTSPRSRTRASKRRSRPG